MTDSSFDDVRTKMLNQLADETFESEAATTIVKNLKTLQEAANIPDSPSTDDETGFKAFLKRNSGDLIKAGSTLGAISLIGLFELKGDVIFRSKASKFI